MRRIGTIVPLLSAGWIGLALVCPGTVAATPSAALAFPPRAILDKYCVGCHNQKLRTAGLTLDTMDTAAVGAHADVWEKVARKLGAGAMPPAGLPRPDK